MKKFLLLIPIVVLIAIGLVLRSRTITQQPIFPNASVLLITIDTVRPDYLSCYGGSNPTPHIDRVASEGVRFQHAFSQVPLTFPSHTSILTGMFPTKHGMHNNGLEVFRKQEMLLPTVLKENGYKTGAVVSSFVLDRKFGLSEGFDVYDDRMERRPSFRTNFEVERAGDRTVTAAQKILEEWGNSKWFLWVHFYDPHTPYAPPEPWQGYGGEVSFVDQQIGVLLDTPALHNSGQGLILAIVGDHGESLGQHREETHGFFTYNSTLRIPMILRFPDAPSGAVVVENAATVDLLPTILTLLGIPDPQVRDGESLLPLIHGSKRKKDIYFESRYPEMLGWNGLRGLIHSRWKLISTTTPELFDLDRDPLEKTNVFLSEQEIASLLVQNLSAFTSREEKTSTGADPETIEKLRSLGYIGSVSSPKRGNEDPKDKIEIWSTYEKVSLWRAEGQKGDALALLESIARKEPENPFFGISLASFYREEGRNADAVRELEHILITNSTDENVYHELALTYRENRSFLEALHAEDAAIALNPNRSEFYGTRASILVELGRFEEARDQFWKVQKMDPNNPVAWNNYGNACRELGDLEEAEKAYVRAIELSPSYAYPYNGLATVLIRQHRTRDALQRLEKALELDPNFVEVYLNMGIAYHTLGDREKARTLYRAFLKVAPDWMDQEKKNAGMLLKSLG